MCTTAPRQTVNQITILQEKKKLQEAIAELKPAIKEGVDFVRAGASQL